MKFNKNSNIYIIVYATVMVVVVAAILSAVSTSLQPDQQANIRIEKMGAILNSIGQGQGAADAANKDAYVEAEFEKYILNSFCVDAAGDKVDGDAFKQLDNLKATFKDKVAMPIFEAKDASGEMLYVVPMYGAGLWGPVWGYMALGADCDKVFGAVFDHKSETPGLGAEISTPAFANQFKGKLLFDGGKFTSIALVKGGTDDNNPYGVDAVTGGTLTSNGVSKMLKDCLGHYVPFFEKVRASLAAPAQVQVADTMIVQSIAIDSVKI